MVAAIKMTHAVDPKQELRDKLRGAERNIRIMGARVLVATYIRPEKTASGLYIADRTRDEEKHQGKTGMVIALGPLAFAEDDTHQWGDDRPTIGDWVMFNVGDTRRLVIGEAECRVLEDVAVQAVIASPDEIY